MNRAATLLSECTDLIGRWGYGRRLLRGDAQKAVKKDEARGMAICEEVLPLMLHAADTESNVNHRIRSYVGVMVWVCFFLSDLYTGAELFLLLFFHRLQLIRSILTDLHLN